MDDKLGENMTETTGSGAAPAPIGATPEQLKAKYGKIYRLDLTLNPDDETEVNVSYVFKKPSTASYDRYLKTASGGMSKALRSFMFDNIIPEYRAKLEADLEEYPALTISAGEKLLSMLGLSKITNLVLL